MGVDKSAAERAILSKLTSAMDLWYSGKTAGYFELFDETFTYFDPFQHERIETRQELARHYATVEGQVNLPRYEFIDLKFSWLSDHCVVTYFLKQFTDDGPTGPTWKTTEVYCELDGHWKISHAHWSAIPENATG